MKICLLGNAASIHIVRWANGLSSLGHEVFLISADSPGIHKINDKVKTFILRVPPLAGYYLDYLQARRIINRIRPDILNTHYASGYGTLSRLIGFHPTLLSVWGSDVFDVPYQNRWRRRIVCKNLTAADRIASTSRVMKQQVKRLVMLEKEIFVTPFGVDTTIFYPTPKRNKETITIGIIKTIDEKYGQIYLVKAFNILIKQLKSLGFNDTAKKLRLEIVGDGPQRLAVQRLVAELRIEDCVTIYGQVSHSEVPNYLNKMDIACFPSTHESESYGVAAVEASACGLPVVVSNIGGLPEVVEDGKTGFLCEPKNPNDLAEKLYELVINPELRQKMGKAGRDFVLANYDWQENLRRMENYLHQVINEYYSFSK